MRKVALTAASTVLSALILSAQSGRSYGPGRVWWDAGQGGALPWEETYDNPDGQAGILNRTGAIRTDRHPFFESLGVNGRACVTCHQPANAMSVSAASLRERWKETQGKDPVFAAVDGSNCPDLPQEALSSHSLLIEKGLFRISLPWPPPGVRPDFRIEVVRDPTGCNQGGAISVFRRPRMAANLHSVAAFMADGREPSLTSQAIGAILVHEQAESHPTMEQLRAIVEFETQVRAAQSADIRGGLLNEKDGPLSFAVWRKPEGAGDLGLQREFRASAARGSDLFAARCASCHVPGIKGWMDIGTTTSAAAGGSPDLPLFRITCDQTALPHPRLGRVFHTQDPGRALISGKCADAGAIVPQQLKGLAARAPYFSNGSARTLREVVEFYGRQYTEEEKQDLVNFLRVL
jgi:cytochrome c peroxidase